ncbi:MAG: ATP-binding protein [Pseudomonadota bacterium]|nr:ATP-binding protein [Pseudomonadota bacterium]
MRPDIHVIVSRLAAPESRASEAVRIAAEIGAEALLVLLHDAAIDALTPAPGFPQTLPGGPAWRAFLKGPHSAGTMETQLPFPGPDEPKLARVLVGRDAVFMLIGGEPSIAVEGFAEAPLLPALLRAEVEQLAGVGVIKAAREATDRATDLAAALDKARVEVRRKADELALTLDRADHLNEQLKRLNETLEQRVSDEIRERLQAEDALRQAQKMEAVGQLTGGVAHDFNNLLTVIMGGLDSIRREIDKDCGELDLARLRRMQSLAFQGAERATTLTSRLLAFARRQPLAPKPLNLNKLVGGLSDLLQRTLGETILLENVSAGGLWLAHADPSELESALMNLAINARDAMPDGGKLTIETANVSLDDSYVSALVEPVPPGQYVMLAVSDTGEGMTKDTVDRVFEPFFTTKEAGKGTGLGLSQVYGFVRQSGGHIRIYSEPGEGTTVKLYLPRDLRTETTAHEQIVGRSSADGGSETILVIEDHERLREYSAGVLRELGYHVLEAADGQAGLTLLRERPEVDLLFTDVVLPGLNGREVADLAMEFRPDLKVLFTTGYSRNAIIHNGRLDEGVSLITKPFTFTALASKVREMLDS